MQSFRKSSVVVLILVLTLGLLWEGFAQSTPSSSTAATSTAVKHMDPAAAKVWNSPQMIKARKWLDDYLRVTAQMTPKEKADYKNELEHLSAKQMKLWLLKFDHEEQQRQQQYKAWQQLHTESLKHALAYQHATQQALASVSKDETASAQEGEKQLQAEEREAAEMQQSKLADLNSPPDAGVLPLTPFGFPYGLGGVHYHVHLYPASE